MCSPSDTFRVPVPRVAWLVLSLLPFAGCDQVEPQVSDPCPRRRGATAERCGSCHPQAYAGWRAGPHAAAYSSPVFQSEYGPDPSTFCSDCHAAAQAQHGHPRADGVDCSSCHPPGDAPVRAEATCAGCHQFNFPDSPLGSHGSYDPHDPLQDTVREWEVSRAAERGEDCVDCHMDPSNHTLLGTRSSSLMRRALRVDVVATRASEGLVVEMELRPGAVGHRVPTGDMFRQLRLRVEVDDAPPRERTLGRVFAQMPADDGDGFALRTVLDRRVPAPGSGPAQRWRVVFPQSDATEVEWSVVHERMPPAQASARGVALEMIRTPMESGVEEVEEE